MPRRFLMRAVAAPRLLIAVLSIGSGAPCMANSKDSLAVGGDASPDRALGLSDSHRYEVAAQPGQLFRVLVEPRGVVPVLSVTKPTGKTCESIQDAGANDDPIELSVIADTDGTYQIEV